MSAFWSSYSRCYDRLWDGPLADVAARWVGRRIPHGARVIECGAGTGLITSRMLQAGHRVTATEPQGEMRDRFKASLPNVSIDARRCEQLLPGDADAVVAVNVLHMVDDPAAAIYAMRSAVGPVGRVIVTVPCPSASIPRVASEMRQGGASRRQVAQFYWLHALLAPLTVATDHGFKSMPTGWDTDAAQVEKINGVLIGAVFNGR